MGQAYDAMFTRYLRAREKGRHLVARPGELIPIKGIEVRVLCAAGKAISDPLPGAGAPSPGGPDEERRSEDDAEDARCEEPRPFEDVLQLRCSYQSTLDLSESFGGNHT